MKTKNQMLSQMLLVAAVLLTFGQTAKAQNPEITYIERSWDDVNKKVIDIEKTITDYTIIEGIHYGDWYPLGIDDGKDHYYVMRGETNYWTLNVIGRAHLILCDNSTITCSGGVKVENNAKIFFYGQKKGNGKILANNNYQDTAGIGSAQGESCGDITIYGGDITASSCDGAGIGGGEDRSGGNITIYGGTIYAKGSDQYNSGRGAGIGGGYAGSGGNITIYGGEITAQGGTNAAGIGGGEKFNGGGAVGNVTIWGGHVTAIGGVQGAGIGGGKDCEDNYGTVTINGGTVLARGTEKGAGIGGGYCGNGCTVIINGGDVIAKGSNEKGDNLTSSAAIGGGALGKGGNVTINGGKVRVESVLHYADNECPEYIGQGFDGRDNGKFTLGNNMRVFNTYDSPNTWAESIYRYKYCRTFFAYQAGYVLIEECPHNDYEDVDETHHKIICSNCFMNGEIVEKTTKTANAKKTNKFVSGPQGISKFDTQTSDDEPIYDLRGHKYDSSMLANGQLPKGIYIRGGKKFVVK